MDDDAATPNLYSTGEIASLTRYTGDESPACLPKHSTGRLVRFALTGFKLLQIQRKLDDIIETGIYSGKLPWWSQRFSSLGIAASSLRSSSQ